MSKIGFEEPILFVMGRCDASFHVHTSNIQIKLKSEVSHERCLNLFSLGSNSALQRKSFMKQLYQNENVMEARMAA